MSFLDPTCADLRDIQLVQNELLRTLNGSKIADKISTEYLLSKFGIMSVNQQNAQIKLLEIWKALNIEDYPLEIRQQAIPTTGMTTRASGKGRPIEIGKSNITQEGTSTSDAIRISNLSPENVTNAKTLYQAKNSIRSYVKSLPI